MINTFMPLKEEIAIVLQFLTEKKEVIWSSELLQKGNEISYIIDMQISGNNIYILDSNDTLRIFERRV